MSYVIEELSNCSSKFIFDINNVNLSHQVDQALIEKQKTADMKGFRKGKVPLSIVARVYENEVQRKALMDFVSHHITDVLEEKKFSVIGTPQLLGLNYEKESQSIKFEVIVEYFPNVKINDFMHLSFKKESAKVSDNDIQKLIDNELDQFSQSVEIKDVALDKGHTAVINFQGEKENGEKPGNMKGEEYLLEIGSHAFIPGFEDALLGMRKGDKRNFPIKFPSDYHVEDMKGTSVTFFVDLLEIKVKQKLDLTDGSAQSVGYKSKSDMKESVRSRLEHQKKKYAQEKLNKEIIDKLVEENQFNIPETLLSHQKKFLESELKTSLKSKGLSESQLSEYLLKWGSDIEKRAVCQVRSQLILKEIARQHSIEISDDDINKKYEEIAKQSSMTVDEIKSYYKDKENVLENFQYAIKEERVFDKICEQVQVIEESD